MALTMNFNLVTVARRITDQRIFGRLLPLIYYYEFQYSDGYYWDAG